jgi:hypothetical protein
LVECTCRIFFRSSHDFSFSDHYEGKGAIERRIGQAKICALGACVDAMTLFVLCRNSAVRWNAREV